MPGLKHGWDDWDQSTHADFVHGAVDPEFGEVETPHRSKRGQKKPNKHKGCPGNDGKGHVYVWTSEREDENGYFFRYFGFHKHERKLCAGCGRAYTRRWSARERLTEQYIKKFKTTDRYSRAEYYDDGFWEWRKEQIIKAGYPAYLYAGWYRR